MRLPCRLPCSGEQPLVRLVPWRPWPAFSWGPVALVELEWDHWLAVLDRVLDLEVRCEKDARTLRQPVSCATCPEISAKTNASTDGSVTMRVEQYVGGTSDIIWQRRLQYTVTVM
eukprot:SAG25_NODE_3578_length_1035_cov_1.201923_1_plen_115_part_00